MAWSRKVNLYLPSLNLAWRSLTSKMMSRNSEQWWILVSGSRFQSKISKLTHYLYRVARFDLNTEEVIERPLNLCGLICWHPRSLKSQSSVKSGSPPHERVISPVWKFQIIRGQNSSLWAFSPAHAAISLSSLLGPARANGCNPSKSASRGGWMGLNQHLLTANFD